MKFFVLLLLSLSAQAAPSPEAIERVLGGYDPRFTMSFANDGYTIGGCYQRNLAIRAIDATQKKDAIIRVSEYLPSDGNYSRSVVILPPMGGVNPIDTGWSNAICSAGIRTLLITKWDKDEQIFDDIRLQDVAAVRSLNAIRHVVEYASKSGSRRIGILGTSVGALMSSLALNVDARIKTGVLIVGGAGMKEILARSEQEEIKTLREKRMRNGRMTGDRDYRIALNKYVKVEPTDFVGFTGPKKLFAIVGMNDTTVPTDTQMALVQRFRATKAQGIGLDHVGTILAAFTQHTSQVVDFFIENL